MLTFNVSEIFPGEHFPQTDTKQHKNHECVYSCVNDALFLHLTSRCTTQCDGIILLQSVDNKGAVNKFDFDSLRRTKTRQLHTHNAAGRRPDAAV